MRRTSPDRARLAALDFGGSSVRAAAVEVVDGRVAIRNMSRIRNRPVDVGGALCWNFPHLAEQALALLWGLGREFDGIAVDSWSSDYVIVDQGGNVAPPRHQSTLASYPLADEWTHADRLSAFLQTGAQLRPYSALVQLERDVRSGRLSEGDRIMLLPDYVTWLLTGREVAEETNASTTALHGPAGWVIPLAARIGLRTAALSEIVPPGTIVGSTAEGAQVIATASHDTAAAVASIPSLRDDVAFVSAGTWFLVGVETEAPVMSDSAFQRRLTNETGVGGRNRLISVSHGLWMIDRCLEAWGYVVGGAEASSLLAAAAEAPASDWVFDPMDPEVHRYVASVGGGAFTRRERAEVVRRILDSLTGAASRALTDLEFVSGKLVRAIHIVGGGSRWMPLARLLANATQRTVFAGPAEATVLGNSLVQAQALGVLPAGVESLREIVMRSTRVTQIQPTAVSGQIPELIPLSQVE